jgi:hypothetical protein
MSTKQFVKPHTPESRRAMAALERAADLARKTAIQTDTAIIVVKDGKRVRITADELRQQHNQ